MAITRRMFLARGAAFVGAAVAGAAAANAAPHSYVRLYGPVFLQDEEAEASEWVQLCIQSSQWHFDDASYEKRVIRHCMTRLTYLVTRDEHGRAQVQQLSPECASCNEDADPDYVVGIAARVVADRLLALAPEASKQHGGPFFFRCKEDSAADPLLNGDTAPAPAVPVTPLTAEALAEFHGEIEA